jgi:hypothetical protein
MPDTASGTGSKITRLILLPSLITLAVTIVRLVGELQNWSPRWFNREMGPSIVAILWLPPIFGIYFALKLANAGYPPKSYLRAISYAALGVVILIASFYAGDALNVRQSFYVRLVYAWTFFAVAALVTLRGWPKLFESLLAYGYAARIPVAIIIFFAYRGNWGTHYDAAPPDVPVLGLVAKYVWLGFFPQLLLWVAFTILAGMLSGTTAAGIAFLVRIERGTAS